MARVNIVLTTTSPNTPAKMERVGGCAVEIIETKAKQPIKKCFYRESISRDEILLQLLADAIAIVKRTESDYESIEIYSIDSMVKNAFVSKWIENWSESEWISAKNEKIKHEDTWKFIWKQINPIMERCIFNKEPSRWSNLLLMECEKELKKVKNARLVEENVRKIKEKLDNGT